MPTSVSTQPPSASWMDTTHAGLKGSEWVGVAGAGASLLPLLAGGGNDPVAASIANLSKNANQAGELSKTFTGQGQDLLGPIMKYLQDVTGGDRQALLQATMPERRRVIDQYATAKKAIAEFTPRGGGQAATGAALQAKEASDLATTTAEARQAGFGQEAALGSNLAGLGLSALGQQSNDLNAIISANANQSAQKAQQWAQVGEAIGMIALMAL